MIDPEYVKMVAGVNEELLGRMSGHDCEKCEYCGDICVACIRPIHLQHEWIKCSNRLPDKEQWCWIYTDSSEVEEGVIYHKNAFYNHEEDEYYTVTHWKPYYKPEPPKK